MPPTTEGKTRNPFDYRKGLPYVIFFGLLLILVLSSSLSHRPPEIQTVTPKTVRPGDELASVGRQRVAAAGVATWNPIFDVTPAKFVTALVTERGVVRRPSARTLAALMNEASADTGGQC